MSFFKTLLFLLLLFFSFGFSGSVSGQGLICDEPIPIGVTLEQLLDLVHNLYKELSQMRGFLKVAEDHIKGVVTKLSGEKVCDFNKCFVSELVNPLPSFGFEILTPFKFKERVTLFGFDLPACAAKCKGNPCPEFKDTLKILKEQNDGIKSSYNKLNKLIQEETETVTEEINLSPQELGEKITRAESIKRNLKLSRLWLHPGDFPIDVASSTEKSKKDFIGKHSCVIGIYERTKLAAGEIVGERFPIQCLDALKQGVYWPRPWSEFCHYECNYGLNKKCRDCLQNSENNKGQSSALAKINYRIYKKCDNDCCDYDSREEKCKKKSLTKECVVCLCGGEGKVNSKECLDWICGGSSSNYVCCHEAPLEFNIGPYKVVVKPDDEVSDIETEAPAGVISTSCAAFAKPANFDSNKDYYCKTVEGNKELARFYQVPYKEQNAPKLDELVSCIKKEAGSIDLGSVFTFENNNPVCNYTRGPKTKIKGQCKNPGICGFCCHAPCSCHYGGKVKPSQGAMAVDIGKEELWKEDKMLKWLSTCQRELGETVCAMVEGNHIHISLPVLGGCDTWLLSMFKNGRTTTPSGNPIKCWGI